MGQIVGFSDRLMVSWNIPSSWPQSDAFQLVFHIRYRPLGSRFWSEVSEGVRSRADGLRSQLCSPCWLRPHVGCPPLSSTPWTIRW